MPTHDLKSSDYAALAEFRYQIRRFLHFSEQAARRAGVEPQHHQLMLALRGAGGSNGCRISICNCNETPPPPKKKKQKKKKKKKKHGAVPVIHITNC